MNDYNINITLIIIDYMRVQVPQRASEVNSRHALTPYQCPRQELSFASRIHRRGEDIERLTQQWNISIRVATCLANQSIIHSLL